MPRSLPALLLVLLLGATIVLGQTATGRLSGTVLDSSGGVIQGAVVTIRSEMSGLTVTLETDASGAFEALALPSGQYSVGAEAEAFQRQIVRAVKVDVARETSLPPIRLELGSLAEAVEVTGGVSQVQTTTAEISSTVTMEQIRHLPLIGRGALDLIYLEAGVAFQGRTPTVINGQRTSFSNVTLDGINIQDNYIRDNGLSYTPNRPLVDQVNEFTITTQNGNAAFGGGSSQVNFTTQAGTNEFHGNLYWHNRNTKFAANQWFSNRAGTEKPFLNRNQAGGSLGGPIIKDRLLFYANYEAMRERAETLTNRQILTADARNGLFTYRDTSGQVRKANVLGLAGVPMDPGVTALLEQVPGPVSINNFDVGDSDMTLLRNTAGYRFNVQNNNDRDALTTRLDFVVSERHWLSGTYQFTRDQPDRPGVGTGYRSVPPVKEFSHTQLVSVGWTWTPGPNWTNELRGGFNLAPGEFRTTDTLPPYFLSGFVFDNPVVNFEPEGRYTDTFNFMDNTAWNAGRHSLRFGASAQRVDVETYTWAGTTPGYGIGINLINPIGLDPEQFPGGISSQDLDAAEGLLTTLGGLISNGNQVFNIAGRNSGFIPGQELRRRYLLNSYGFYGQDSWRVRPALTLSLGLRWEYTGRADEKDGLWLSPVIQSGNVHETLLSNATLDFAGSAVDRPLYEKDLNNFAPNIGLAYDVFGNGRTALRAGYSINYVNDEAILAVENAATSNNGLVAPVSFSFLDRRVSGPLPPFPTPEFKVPRTAADNFPADPVAALFAVDPQLRSAYVQQWNIGVQHEMFANTVFEVRYVGNKGTKLWRGFDLNQVIIRENGFLEDFQRARSNGFLSLSHNGIFNPAYNPGIAGSQQLTVFPRLVNGGQLSNTVVRSLIQRGEVADLAGTYYGLGFAEGSGVQFVPNLNTFVADLIANYSNSSYNALQVQMRRRAAAGVQIQANYTYGKTLTDSSGTLVRFDPFLDNASPGTERSRADFDLNHVFNVNFVWPLPLGKGGHWDYKPLNSVISGWTIASTVSWQSGAPLSILSGRGTINRAIRSRENTAVTPLTKPELDEIVDFRMTPDGPFLIAASAINPRNNTGVAADGAPPFEGQAFAHPGPGETGVLQRRMFNGPSSFGLDLAIDKSIRFREVHSILIGAQIANALNHPAFFSGSHFLDSTQFGRINSVLIGGRVIEFRMRYSF